MKKTLINLFVIAVFLFGISAIYSSCKKEEKDPCEGVTCNNGGSCSEGTCNCATGYEGTNCNTVMRDKFIGDYTATDNPCTSASYDVTISTSSTGIDKIVIKDFGKFLCNGDAPDPIATVNAGSLSIANQTFCAGNDITISGNGSISSDYNTITITYTTSNAGNTVNCTAVLVRK